MGTSDIANTLASTAVSMTVAGNTGVSTFLTMFLVGTVSHFYESVTIPEHLEKYLSSWPAMIFWGIMMILELLSKCIPVIDEVVDGVMAFVVPFMSILATYSTWDLYTVVDILDGDANVLQQDNNRSLQEQDQQQDDDDDAITTAVRFFQYTAIVLGILISIAIHLLKMIIRLLGEGWLTPILAVVETVWVGFTVVSALFIKQVGVVVAIIFLIMSIMSARKRYQKYKEKKERTTAAAAAAEGNTIPSPLMPTAVNVTPVDTSTEIPIVEAVIVENSATGTPTAPPEHKV